MCASGLGLGLAKEEATRQLRRANRVTGDRVMVSKRMEEDLSGN